MNLIRLTDLTKEQIFEIFEIADSIDNNEFNDILDKKTAVLFFPESSIRTRISFEKGVGQLGGQPILFPPTALDKKEKLEDVISYIQTWADIVIVRHRDMTKVEELAKYSKVPIINALTWENHPCEILTDMYSFREMRDNYLDLTYTFVGENGNIANSYLRIAELLDLKFRHVCLNETYRLKEDDKNYIFSTDLDKYLIGTDVFLTDPLPNELRNEEYYRDYQLTLDRLNVANEDCLVNPCPPFNRDQEIHRDVIDSKHFVGYEFKKNLLKVQQAIMIYCLTKS